MEIFAGAIGAQDEYSILIKFGKRSQFQSNLNKAATFIHSSARGLMLQVLFFFFFTKKKVASSFSAINVLNNKTIFLLNLAEYLLILANSVYGLVG